jgi:hypothetical protein
MSSIKERITELKGEIRELEFQLALKKNAFQELEALSSKKGSKGRRKSKALRKGSLPAYLQKILMASDKALTVSELVEKLKETDYKSKTDLKTVIPSALTRKPEFFVRVRYGVYGLVGKHDLVKEK